MSKALSDLVHGRRWKSQCGGKQKHQSQGKAEAASRSLEQRFGEKVNAYFCRYCKNWHVGHGK